MLRVAKVSNNKKRQIDGMIDQAVQAMNQGRLDVCEQLCLRVESMQPHNADAASIRGVVASGMGEHRKAIAWFRAAIEVAPRRCEFHANLAGIYLLLGKHDKALKSYQRALELKPNQLQIQLGCASALISLERFGEALAMMLSALKRHPDHVSVLMKLFRITYEGGKTEAAENWISRVLVVEPEHAEAHYCYAMLLSESGRRQESVAEVREALRLQPGHADALLLLSELKRFTERDADVEMLAKATAETESRSAGDRIKLNFAYGKVLDDLGDYDAAFDCFEQANELRSTETSYELDQELAHMQMLMDNWTAEVVQQESGGLDDSAPIFIVGMPRCGSTLVEQILAAHPDLSPCGECGCFESALAMDSPADDLLTVDKLVAYTGEKWQQLGHHYIQLLQSDQPEATHYSDKTLTNIRLIGAIHRALPHARIIHVRRNPLDNCLSIYRHNLLGSQFDYGSKLGELGYYYRMYQQLMQHWRDVLPDGVLYELDYESLVDDQETQTRQLLEACGLTWDDRCLRFYEADNTVRTASFMQVRKPISTSSVGVWKHYEGRLAPLIRILER